MTVLGGYHHQQLTIIFKPFDNYFQIGIFISKFKHHRKLYFMKNIFLSLVLLFALSFANTAVAEDDATTGEAQADNEKEKTTEGEKKAEEKKPEVKKKTEAEKRAEMLQLMDLFGDVFQKVRDDYVEEAEDKKLIETSINGMLTSLDPHSSFMNEEDFKEMREQTKGEFGGLGIEVTLKNGLVYVVAPIDDTPAFKAGLKSGDYISHIDGEAVYGLTIGDAVKKMRGKPGTSIAVKIVREGEKKPLDITIVRDIIKVKSVKSKVHDDVGYIRVTSFTEDAGKKVAEEMNKIYKETGKDKIKGWVVDLRNNPGGLLNEAISISDVFLEKGEIVSTRGRHAKDSQKYDATAGDITDGAPVIVMINSGSASASEIVAGALQDHKRAVIIGEKSFGKGSVQTVIPLASNTAIRLTTSRYYTPSGNSIQAEGITPDVEIKQGKLTYNDDFERTTEANLKGHLANPNGGDNRIKKIIKKLEKDKKAELTEADLSGELTDEDKPLDETDYQLARGLDLVRALFIYRDKAN
jgi:carboxyl-terminal processing protease